LHFGRDQVLSGLLLILLGLFKKVVIADSLIGRQTVTATTMTMRSTPHSTMQEAQHSVPTSPPCGTKHNTLGCSGVDERSPPP
jgi:hypothetical protein